MHIRSRKFKGFYIRYVHAHWYAVCSESKIKHEDIYIYIWKKDKQTKKITSEKGIKEKSQGKYRAVLHFVQKQNHVF